MEPFNPFNLVSPIVNLLTETGNFAINILSLVLRIFGISFRFF